MTVRLSVSVMAHPVRYEWTEDLLNRTGLSWDHVVWDQGKGRWDTGRRAWELADPDASHHLVLQDDALPCQDLILGLEMALARIPAHRVLISLFFGTPHAGAQGLSAKERAIGRAQQVGASWIILRSLNWGLGIVLPTAVVPNMLDWCDQQTYPEYDKRVGLYARDVLGWKTWYTWPSLVEHRVSASLCEHECVHAYQFLGEMSALEANWDGPIVGKGA